MVSPAGCACRWLSAARSPRVRRQREGLAARPRSAGRAEERRRVGAAPPRMRRTLPGGAATRSRAATERRWYAPDPASDRRGSARCTTRLGCAESILSPRDPRARPGRGAPGRREQGLARPPAQGPHRAKTAAGSRARMQQSCIRGGIARCVGKRGKSLRVARTLHLPICLRSRITVHVEMHPFTKECAKLVGIRRVGQHL